MFSIISLDTIISPSRSFDVILFKAFLAMAAPPARINEIANSRHVPYFLTSHPLATCETILVISCIGTIGNVDAPIHYSNVRMTNTTTLDVDYYVMSSRLTSFKVRRSALACCAAYPQTWIIVFTPPKMVWLQIRM